MEYTYLKSTGLKVSRLCLGTMTFGGQTDQGESRRILDCALDNGVNFIDTANIYTGGESERIIGETLGARRDSVVLATKVCGPAGKGPNQSGLSRKAVLWAVEDSLRRLRTDYIDILYMHFPDPRTGTEETIETMTDLVRSGKIRYYGMSNFSSWQVCETVLKAREMNAVAPSVTETVYSLLARGMEDEFAAFLTKYQMGMAVFNPLAGGLLTGKHSREHYTEGTRFALEKGYANRYWNEKNFDAVDVFKTQAERCGMTLIQFAYRWLLSHSYVDSLICGVSKLSQLEENISYFDGKTLPEDVFPPCDAAWQTIKGAYFNYHY